jgi:hypothetical protein
MDRLYACGGIGQPYHKGCVTNIPQLKDLSIAQLGGGPHGATAIRRNGEMIYDFIKTTRTDQARRMFSFAGEGVVWAALENLHAVWGSCLVKHSVGSNVSKAVAGLMDL